MKQRVHTTILADEGGQTLIVTALCMMMLMGFLGLAIDVGQLRLEKRRLQGVADAAALAAGREIRVCGVVNGAQSSTPCTYMISAAESSLAENGYTGVTASRNVCSNYKPGSGVSLLVNNPACLLASDPNKNTAGYVEVVVSKNVQTWFSQLFGLTSVPISARAEATRILSPPCVYALDPHGDGAITILAGLGVQSKCAIIDESDSPNALVCTLGLAISAPKISITGGASKGLLSGLLCGSSAPTRTNAPLPSPADPLAYLPAPPSANDPCGGSPVTKGLTKTYTGSSSQVNVSLLSGGLLGNIVFNPGVYCGGINIVLNVATTITFNPGIYILRPLGGSGGLSMTAGGVLSTIQTGSGDPGGVMFYNEGPAPSSSIGGFNINIPSVLGTFNLKAPTSGEYAGVLFYQQSTNTAQSSFLANLLLNGLSVGNMDGAIYAPSATVFYGVSAIGTNNNILVAKDITTLAGVLSTFGSSYAANSLGSPLIGDDAVLVQ